MTAAALVAASAAFAQDVPQGGRVEVNGMQMYYEVSGDGDPIIVLHGSQMSIPQMSEIIDQLGETHRVYALEFQGHGRTPDIDRRLTYPDLADDVATFMDAVGIEKADVFGYSMGATAGLRLAIDHPQKVDQLIFASGVYDFAGYQAAFGDAIPTLTVEEFTAPPLAEEYKSLAPNPDGFPELVKKLIDLERQPLAWGEQVTALDTPVLIIAGDADGITLDHVVSMFRLLGGGCHG
ncbi:MAG: alpha/beta hydrolase [Devosia sp.]